MSVPTSGQRTSAAAGALGKKQAQSSIILNILAALIMVATYAWTVLSQQGIDNAVDAGTNGTIVLPLVIGYLVAVILLILANVRRLPLSVIALVPFAAALNIVIGQLVGISGIPLYLDSIATIFIGYLAGPAAGAMTGAVTNLVWGLTVNPTTIPFAAGAALIGMLAGFAGRYGLFEKIWKVIVAGFITGIIAGLVAAPVAAYVYGGGLGVGTGSVVAAFQAAGNSILAATTFQSLLSDPLDKTIAFLIVFLVAKAIPQRALANFRSR